MRLPNGTEGAPQDTLPAPSQLKEDRKYSHLSNYHAATGSKTPADRYHIVVVVVYLFIIPLC